MDYKHSFTEIDGDVIPVVSIRVDPEDEYIDIDRYQIRDINNMFRSWNVWWEEEGKAIYENEEE